MGTSVRRFAIRTIRRDGSVLIYGRTFKPMLDASKFAGMRAAFGLYLDHWTGKHDGRAVSLWGTERAYRSKDESIDWPGPFCEDGKFKWEWWECVRVGR
jgi:hypothetical protein